MHYEFEVVVHVAKPGGTAAERYRYVGEFVADADLAEEPLRIEALKRALTECSAGPATDTEESPEAAARRLAGELTAARERSARLSSALDARDNQVRELVEALTGGEFPLPWWMRATHALDSLDRLANSATLDPA